MFTPQDIFHCQIMDGNLTQNLEKYFPIIGKTGKVQWFPSMASKLSLQGLFLSKGADASVVSK